MSYFYRGTEVIIPRGAEITTAFYYDGAFGSLVQQTLDEIEPWEKDEDPIETFDLPRLIGARVVELATSEEPIWGVNPHHKARQPGLSPFITLDPADYRNRTDIATLELAGTVESPVLTRVYPGDYMPPLPWMRSAPRADGGLEVCEDYWNHHAFILRPQSAPEQLTSAAPDWYVAQPSL